MSLSFNFLYTSLSNRYKNVIKRVKIDEYMELASVGYLHPKGTFDTDILYFDIGADMGNIHNDIKVCLVTSYERVNLFPKCNIIMMESMENVLSAINVANRVFIKMAKWERDIYKALASNQSPQKIIDITAKLVKNPMYISDSSFKMIARWGDEMGEANSTWRYQIKYSYLPYTVTEDLIESGEIEEFYGKKNAWVVRGSVAFPNLPFVSKSIQKDGKHFGNFFIIEFYKRLNDCDLEVADKLGDILSVAKFGEKNYLESSTLYHSHFLAELIEGSIEDNQIVRDQVRALGWNMNDKYFLALYNTVEDDIAICNHLIAMITSNIDAQCLIYKDRVLAVVNCERDSEEKFLTHIKSMEDDFNRSVGISECYKNFLDTAQYYDQACFALEYTPKEGKSKAIMYSNKFAADVIRRIDDYMPTHYAVDLLHEYDIKHNSDLCKTLYKWIAHDRNTVATAESMYLHRNTLMNRLKRIEEIMGINLDDINVRLRVLLSLYSLGIDGVE